MIMMSCRPPRATQLISNLIFPIKKTNHAIDTLLKQIIGMQVDKVSVLIDSVSISGTERA